MTKYITSGLLVGAGLFAMTSAAHAHFNLVYPPSSTAQNATGDPQKTGPCPKGTATNMVTKLTAGDTITVKINETISHGGHFRFSIGDPAMMKDPTVTGRQCAMAAIENPPKLPTLMDGALVHPEGGRKMWEQAVKIPDDFTCEKCTFQVLQFMTQHGEPCFYYHCADVSVAAKAGGGTPDAGASPDASSGAGGSGGGSGGAGGGTGGSSGASGGSSGSGGSPSATGGSSGTGTGGSPSATGGSSGSSSGGSSGSRGGSSGSATGGSAPPSDGGGSGGGGCSVGGRPDPFAAFGLASLIGALLVRARRRR